MKNGVAYVLKWLTQYGCLADNEPEGSIASNEELLVIKLMVDSLIRICELANS